MSFETKFRNFVGRIKTLTLPEIEFISKQLLEELNKEKGIFFKEDFIKNFEEYPDEIWDEIDKQIKKSRVKRYSWKKIIGETLTKRILRLRNKGLTIEETINTINRLPGVEKFIEMYPEEEENLAKNIKINVHARYGENKTSENLKENKE